jgi:hypothetical protein
MAETLEQRAARVLSPNRSERTRNARENRFLASGTTKKPNINTLEGARAYAEQISAQTGEPLPEKPQEKVGNFRKVLGLLNASSSYMSGLVGGAIDPNVGAFEEASRRAKLSLSGKEFLGFSDTIRQVYNPDDRAGKVFVAVTGFVGDVVFDPLTYLTFGMGTGAKLGAKTLTKTATRRLDNVAYKMSSNTERVAEYAKKYGVPEQVASAKLGRRAKELFDMATSKKGLTKESAEEFIKLGVERGDIETLQRLGSTMLDQGGVKFFGKTLVTSKQLANTPVGKAARRLGETETVKAVIEPVSETLKIWKDVLGKMFVPDFKKNPDAQKAIDIGNARLRDAQKNIVSELSEKIFPNFDKTELSKFHNEVQLKKIEVNELEKRIQEKGIKFIQKKYPELGIKTPEDAKAMLPKLEDFYTKKTDALQKTIERLTKNILEKATAKGGVEFDGIRKYQETIQNLRAMISDLGDQVQRARGIPAPKDSLLSVELSENALKRMGTKLIRYEEERLSDIASALETKLRNLKENPVTGTGVSGEAVKKANEVELLLYAQKQLEQFSKELGNSEFLLSKVAFGARKQAKALQKGERLIFDNPKFQKAADLLFEGDNAFVKRLSKLAGIPEDQAMKFYIPTIVKDKLEVNSFAHGQGLSGVNTDFRKRFTGNIEGNIETNAFKAYATRGVQVAAARIKSETVASTLRHLGKPISSMTKEEAVKRGYKEYKVKNLIDENMTSEVWVKKEVYDQLKDYEGRELGIIDKAAKVFGFDYVTGLTKSWLLLSPAYTFRNMTSNSWNIMMHGTLHALDPRSHIDAVNIMRGRNLDKKIVAKNGKIYNLGEIKKMVGKSTTMIDETQYGRAELMINEADNLLAKSGRIPNFNPFSRENILLRANMNFANSFDKEAKWAMIIGELKSGKPLKEAIKNTEDTLFNYGKLTEFERSVMRRLIPFYTYARKNAELQAKTLATNPGIIANQVKGIGAAGEAMGDPITEEDMEGLPQFVLDSFGIKGGSYFDNEYGQPTYFTGFGLPIEEFLGHFKGEQGIVGNAIADILSISNPIIKANLEATLDKDFFRGRPITKLDNASSAKWMVELLNGMSPKVGEQFKDMINWREIPNFPVYENGVIVDYKTRYEADPFALHFMRSIFTSRVQSQVGYLTSDEESNLNTFLRLFTGVKGWSIDKAEQEYYNNLQEKEDLINWLDDMGVNIGKTEINYLKN